MSVVRSLRFDHDGVLNYVTFDADASDGCRETSRKVGEWYENNRARIRVGNGAAVHHGSAIIGRLAVDVVIDVPRTVRTFKGARTYYSARTFPAGSYVHGHVYPACGTASVHKTGGYANGWLGKNSVLDDAFDVTCAKCLKIAGAK